MKQKIVQGLSAFIFVLLLVSCSSNEDTSGNENSEQVRIRFTIATSTPETRSGTWGDNDYTKEDATEWENAIESNKLQVLVYDKDDKFICEVGNLTFVSIGNSPYQERNVYGTLPLNEISTDDGKLTCRLVVLANFDTRVSPDKNDLLSNISDDYYAYDADAFADKTTYIPMWGVQTYKEENGTDYQPLIVKKGETAEANIIYLLRAVSKIRVSINNAVAENFSLNSVNISDYNLNGYILPKSYSVESTNSLRYEDTTSPSTFNPYSQKAGKVLPFTKDTTGKIFTVYLPECETSSGESSNATDPFISVTLKSTKTTGTQTTYRINLQHEDSKQTVLSPMNLIRNTLYDYIITSVGPDMSLKYQAIEWTKGGGTINFN